MIVHYIVHNDVFFENVHTYAKKYNIFLIDIQKQEYQYDIFKFL